MSKIWLLLFLLCPALVFAQSPKSESEFKKYFNQHLDSLNTIEGIWNIASTQEYYANDTLYDIHEYPKAARVAIFRNGENFETYDMNGEPYNVQFSPTDVAGVYTYRNYLPETKQYSKTQAVISKQGEMEYTYDFPVEYLREKLKDSFEEGTRVVNILKWTKVYPGLKK